MKRPSSRAATAAAFLALGSAWLWFYRAHAADALTNAVGGDLDMGEQLLHALRLPQGDVISGTMPLYTAWTTFVCERFSPQAQRAVCLLTGEAAILLVFVLGWLLGAAPGALAALGVFMLVPGLLYVSNPPQLVYAVMLLIVAGLLVRRARNPSTANSLFAGLAIGASLLFRSPLAFLPPILGVLEWRARRRGAKRDWRAAAALCAVPYLFLIPWLRTNYILHHQWIPFEYKRADMNIVMGALGLVPNADGDWRRLMNNPPDTQRTGAVLIWAAGEVMHHPVRYVLSIFARLVYVASMHPWVFAAGMAALLLFASSAGFRVLGLLIAYFIGIHSLMTIAPDYMTPLWPLLAVAASGLLYKGFIPEGAFGDEDAPAAARLLQGVAALFLIAALLISWKVWVYPERLARRPAEMNEAFKEALAEDPDDVWLLIHLGHEELKRNDPQAAALFARALDLKPGDEESVVSSAWARALAGAPGDLWGLEPYHGMKSGLVIQLRFMQSFAYLKAGRPGKARESALAGLDFWESTCDVVNRVTTKLEKKIQRDLRPSPSLTSILSDVLAELPPKDRLDLLDEIAGLAVPDHAADVWIALARSALSLGDQRMLRCVAAEEPLLSMSADEASQMKSSFVAPAPKPPRARPSGLPAMEDRALISLALKNGRQRTALGYADRLVSDCAGFSRRERARARAERARIELELSEYAKAEEDLREAARLAPDCGTALMLAEALNLMGKPAEALSALTDRQALLDGAPARDRARWFAARGVLRLELHDDEGARADLAQAIDADAATACLGGPVVAPRGSVGVPYFDVCVTRYPDEASLWRDRGVARFVSTGDSEGAQADFREALKIRPDSLEAALSLAALLEQSKRGAEALAILDGALAKAGAMKKAPAYAAASTMANRLRKPTGRP